MFNFRHGKCTRAHARALRQITPRNHNIFVFIELKGSCIDKPHQLNYPSILAGMLSRYIDCTCRAKMCYGVFFSVSCSILVALVCSCAFHVIQRKVGDSLNSDCNIGKYSLLSTPHFVCLIDSIVIRLSNQLSGHISIMATLSEERQEGWTRNAPEWWSVMSL